MARPREEGMEERILEAAIRVFGERGFEATTLKEIAAGAGISPGSVYTYFADKDNLFNAAVGHGWERFLSELEALAVKGLRREERMVILLDRGFATLEMALPLLRGMLFDASRKRILDPSIERVTTAIDNIMKPDSPDGADTRPVDPRVRRNLIRIIVNGILFTTAFHTGQDVGDLILELKAAIGMFIEHYEKYGPLAIEALLSGRRLA